MPVSEFALAISLISDEEIYERILEGCRQKRLELNFTQAELGKRSGLSTRTVRGFEGGQSVNFMSLIKIMRALGEFNRLSELVIERQISPKAVFLNSQEPTRKRARRGTP